MSKWLAIVPLAGFFLALIAFWIRSRAREAGIDANLQKRLWDHNKYQREYGEQTPLEVSEWLFRQQVRLNWLAALLALLAAGCFAYTLLNLNRLG